MSRSMPDDGPEITPQVMNLNDILKWLRSGRLRLPHFQRHFVWGRQHILDLLDSVANQYPIGSIFLWSKDPMPPSRDSVGPLALPDTAKDQWLILDGQQRLTTLAGVLLRDEEGWEPSLDDEDSERWYVYFDAEADAFTHWSATPAEAAPPASYIPAHEMLDVLKFWAWADRSRPHVTATAIRRVQEVSRAFQSYRVPLVMFKSDELRVAVESFSRLNRKGRSISEDEMFSALTYDQDFHLAVEIDGLQKDMVQDGFGRMDRTILLRAVLAAAGLDIYRTDWNRLGEAKKTSTRQELPNAVIEARAGLSRARDFLCRIGILNSRMLPYSMQLVALSAFFGRCADPNPAQRAFLERWFWVSSFTGWFGGQNPSRVRDLIVELRDRVSRDADPRSLRQMDLDQPALPTPNRFDLRSARVRALLCVLLAREPRGADNQPFALPEAAKLLQERGAEATTRVFATVADKTLRTSPANRILDVMPQERGQARNWLKTLEGQPADVRATILESHALPIDAFDLLVRGESDAYLQERMKLLEQIERAFMLDKGVVLGPVGAGQSAIDTDDEPPLDEDYD